MDLSTLPTIAGATWEMTNNWDCSGNDIENLDVSTWGTDGSIEDRRSCARRCLSLSNCVAFNFPNSGSSSCYLKHTYRKSQTDGRDWNCGDQTGNKWQYYTLISKTATCPGITTLILNNLYNLLSI